MSQTLARASSPAPQCPAGFRAAGGTAGIKPSGKPDLAVIIADRPASAAALLTRNLVRAAPLEITRTNLAASGGTARGVVISSGCANAATGEQGFIRAQRVVDACAAAIGCAPSDVLINSTGVIGVQLPDDKIRAQLPALVAAATSAGFGAASEAIMTTDTYAKTASRTVSHGGRNFTVTGMAKGAGMIHPNMATMIAVILTDALIAPAAIKDMLIAAADRSFHRISVDGDTSTNDSVFLLASGEAGEFPLATVRQAVTDVARELALMIVRDGEGAKKLLHVHVAGARTQGDALAVAQTVAGSLLVRTAVAGGDPNWGRILAAIGRAGVDLDIPKIRVTASGVPLFHSGAPASDSRADAARVFGSPPDGTLRIDIDLGLGAASDEFFTCDLTEGYIEVNAHYTT